jgi:hypothetical protein
MDACGNYVVAASAPLEIRVWRVIIAGATALVGKPTATFTVVRELSIMTVGQPLRVSTCILLMTLPLLVCALLKVVVVAARKVCHCCTLK